MILLLPVSPGCAREHAAMLATPEFSGLVRRLAETARAEGCIPVVHCDDLEIHGILKADFPSAYLESAREAVQDGLGLPGARNALRTLLRTGEAREDEPVVVANWRFPDIGRAGVQLARGAAEAGLPGIAATLREARDTPVQYMVPWSLWGLDALVFPDARALASGRLVTRPFFLDWAKLGLDGADCRAALVHDGRSPVGRLEPVEPDRPDPGGRAAVFERLSPLTARRLLPREGHPGGLTGLPAYGVRHATPVRASLGSGGDIRLALDETGGLPAGTVVRAWPTFGERIGQGTELPLPARGAFEASLPCHEEPSGCILALLSPGGEEGYHFTEPVLSDDGLWTICPRTNARLHPETGAPMFNRQHYPRLMEPDGVLLAGTVRALLDPDPAGPVTLLDLDPGRKAGGWPSHLACCAPGHTDPEPEPAGGPRQESPWRTLAERSLALESDLQGCPGAPSGDRLDQWNERFDALLEDVEQLAWPVTQCNRWVLHCLASPFPRPDLHLELVTDAALVRVNGLRHHAWASADRWLRQARTAQQPPAPRRPAMHRTASAPLRVRTPHIPWALASDGEDRLFVTAYEFQDYRSGLFSVDARTGAVEALPFHGMTYGGLWFDPAMNLLYGLHFLQGKTPSSGLDILDREGKLLDRIMLSDDRTGQPFAAYSLAGNAQGLFFADATSRGVILLDKGSLRRTGTVASDVIPTPTAVSAQGNVLTICDRSWNTILDHDLRTGRRTLHSNVFTRLTHKMIRSGAWRHAVCYEYEPYGPQAQGQWLRTFDEDCALVRSRDLGMMRVLDMHLLHGPDILAIADYREGVVLLGLETG